MKCRYGSIGHTFLWVQWKLRHGQASPMDLLRAKGANPLVLDVGRANWTGLLYQSLSLDELFDGRVVVALTPKKAKNHYQSES